MSRPALNRPLGGSFGKAKDLKKVNLNPKFAGARSKLKTGSHAGNVKVRKDRSGELFKRITRNTLMGLIKEQLDNEESIYDLNPSDMLSVTTIENEDELKIKEDLRGHQFIVCDLRDRDAFDDGHILGAIHVPAVNINRDKFPPAVYAARNVQGKVLIFYAHDEKTLMGAETLTSLAQKQWNNAFMLTGGLKAFQEKYPGCVEVPGISGTMLGDTGASPNRGGRLSPRQTLARQQGVRAPASSSYGRSGGGSSTSGRSFTSSRR